MASVLSLLSLVCLRFLWFVSSPEPEPEPEAEESPALPLLVPPWSWSEPPEVDDASPSAPLPLELGAADAPDDGPDDKSFPEDDEAPRWRDDPDVDDDEASVVLALLLEASTLDM